MALNKWDKQHLINIGLTERQIDKLFNEAIKEAAAIGVSIHDFSPDKPFSFADYPITKARIEKLLEGLQNNVETVIVNGVASAWTLANNKNNALCDRVFGDNKYKLTKEQERKYYNNNDKALEAFIKRKTNGLNLSDRVWDYTDGFKNEIEMGLDLGIRNGLSAAEMARDLKQYLREPDRLFRRVRDEHGQLHLSKAAKAYHPGAGSYRSSYKNAMRLARTENNMAYRTSDHERWQQLDFVVGIEVRLSNNHTLNGKPFTDICDELKGKYPKTFKFTGWHPQCRCHAISVLKTPEELAKDTERIMNGEDPTGDSENSVKDVPDNYKKWVADNADRIERAEQRGTLPYFLKDNDVFMKYDSIKQEETRPQKTEQQKQDIQARWNERMAKMAKIKEVAEYEERIDSSTTINEVKKELKQQLNKILGYDVDIKISTTDTTLDVAKLYAKELSKLCTDYKIEQLPLGEFNTKQSKKWNGCVSSKGTKVGADWVWEPRVMNVGSIADHNRIRDVAWTKSLCDKDKLQLSTINHEFAHLMMTYDSRMMNNTSRSFFRELKVIESSYISEMNSIAIDSKERNAINLGYYADKNTDEFMAEAFQEYRNRKTPSKYAVLVGELIDKYYKK